MAMCIDACIYTAYRVGMDYEQTIEEVRRCERELHARADRGEVPKSLADAYSAAVAKRSDAK